MTNRLRDHVVVLNRKHKGFSSLEILVAMGTVVILIGALVASFWHVRHMSFMTKCQSNLRALGIAHGLYRGENGGFYVPYAVQHGSDGTGGSAQFPWSRVLWDAGYAGSNIEIFRCPLVEKEDSLSFTHVSYGYNHLHIGGSTRYQGDTYQPANISQLQRPSGTLLMTDAHVRISGDGGVFRGRYIVGDRPHSYDRLPHVRHKDLLNVCFADGHVKSIKVRDKENPYAELGEVNNENSLFKR